MTQPRRDTRYAREIATAKRPSGQDGKCFVAIERIFVRQAEQIEIRFSSWEGSRMLPRPLDLPEAELFPLMRAAIEAGVLSEAFLDKLRHLLGGVGKGPDQAATRELTELDRVQAHFHDLMRSRAGDQLREYSASLPSLVPGVGT